MNASTLKVIEIYSNTNLVNSVKHNYIYYIIIKEFYKDIYEECQEV